MKKIIGTATTYHGSEHAYLRGNKVRIVAVMKSAAAPGHDPDKDGAYLRGDEDIARAGGITADDRIEVQPWIEQEGRFSFATSDPRATDLGCFKNLRRNARRRERDQAMRDLGLIKVRGALGGTYWE
jgi:hypothetical protein